jgi:hypothetical protein
MKLAAVILTVVVALSASAARFAAAATLGTSSSSVGAASATVAACDTDGFTYPARVVNSSHFVTSLTVAGVNAACAGSTLTVNLADASGASIGSGTAAIAAGFGGGNVVVTITSSTAASSIAGYRIAIVGP